MTDYILNDAQKKALEFLKEDPNEEEYTLQIPTGVGKSFIVLNRIRINHRVMIVFPRLALLSQFYRDYLFKYLPQRIVVCECTDQKDIKDTAKEDIDCFNSLKSKNISIKDKDEIIILTTYHSFPLAIKKYKHLNATIFDEAHHRSEYKIIDFFENLKNKKKCGIIYNFSATCDYDVNEGICFNYPFQDAIKEHLIRDFSVHVMICSKRNQKPKNPQHFVNQVERIAQLSNQKNPKYMAFSAFSEAEKENRSNVTKVVKEWSSFNKYWIEGITGNTKPNDRENVFKDFADYQGSFAALISCRTLGEGIDIRNVNGVVFIDPRNSTREIIQIIGRALRLFRDSSGKPLPWEEQLPAVVVLPVYVDIDEYEALDNEEDQDNFLRDAVENQDNGTFTTVLNVASALREHNPEMSELCLFYPQGCPSKDVPKIRQHLATQGYTIQGVPTDGNCFFSCITKALSNEKKTAGDWRQEIISDLQNRPFQEFGIDPESVKDLYLDSVWNNEAMDVVPEVAAEYLGRSIRIHQGDGRVDCFGPDNGIEPIDLLLSENHYSLLVPELKKGSKDAPQCSKEKPNREKRAQPRKKKFHFHLDENIRVLWKLRSDILSRGLGQLEHRIEKNLGVFTKEEKGEFLIQYANKEKKAPIRSYKAKYTKNGVELEVRLGGFWSDIKQGQCKELLPKLLENEYLKKNYEDFLKKKETKPTEEFTPEEKADLLIQYANKEKKVPSFSYKEKYTKNGVELEIQLGLFWHSIKQGHNKELLPKLLENQYLKKYYDDYLKKKGAKPTEEFSPEEKADLLIEYANKEKKAPLQSYKEKHTKNGVELEIQLGIFWNSIKQGQSKELPKLLENKYLKKNYEDFLKKKESKPTEEFSPEEKTEFLIQYANKEKKTPSFSYKEKHTKNGVELEVQLGGFWTNTKRGQNKELLAKLLENQYLKKNYEDSLKKKEEFTPKEKAEFLIQYANKEKKTPSLSYKEKHTKNGVELDIQLGIFWNSIKHGQNKELLPKLLENEYLKKAYDDFLKKRGAKKATSSITSSDQEDPNEDTIQNLDDTEYDDDSLPLPDDDDSMSLPDDDDSLPSPDDDDSMSSITTTANDENILDKDAEIQRLQKELESLKQNKTGYKKGQYLAPNIEMKRKINHILAEHLPSEGLVIVLDHTDFGTATTLSDKDSNLPNRLLIPQRGLEEYQEMKNDVHFGDNVQYEDIINTLKRKNKKPMALVYADLMGSIKEAEPILDELKKCNMIDGSVIAITICCRDGEESDYTNQYVSRLTKACYKRWPTLDELTENKEALVYGEGIRMATMIFRT